MLTSETVKQWGKECGADLVGIGSMDRFEGAPRDFDPRYIFPDAGAIIGLGFRVHRGLLRGIEEGTFFAAYPSLGYANINDVHAPMALRRLGSLIEDGGHEAMLYSNTSLRYGANAGRPVAPGLPRPDVFLHFRVAAFICGLGEIGYSKVFLTPQFGPRQRFAFILTDAPLEPDPLYDGPPLCDRCKRCVGTCPASAISPDKTVRIEVAGRTVEWGELDVLKCSIGWQAASPEYNPFASPQIADLMQTALDDTRPKEQRAPYARYVSGRLREDFRYSKAGWESFHHPGAICGGRGCFRECMVHLEEQGKMENRFQKPFRRREPWRLSPDEPSAG